MEIESLDNMKDLINQLLRSPIAIVHSRVVLDLRVKKEFVRSVSNDLACLAKCSYKIRSYRQATKLCR